MGWIFLIIATIVVACAIAYCCRLEHYENMAKIANQLSDEMKEYIKEQVRDEVLKQMFAKLKSNNNQR